MLIFKHYANMILCIITSTVQFGGQPCWAVSSYCTVGSLRRGRGRDREGGEEGKGTGEVGGEEEEGKGKAGEGDR